MSNKPTWQRTRIQNLLKNSKSGRFYGRWVISGKQIWRALDTDVFTVATVRLNEASAKIERRRGSVSAVASGGATMADLLAVYEERCRARVDVKASTIANLLGGMKKVLKTWPGLKTTRPTHVTAAAVEEWANRFKAEGTNFTPPGAKTAARGNSAASVNKAIDALRKIMDIALERGAIHTNPVSVKPRQGRLRKKVVPKKLVLPGADGVARMWAAMEGNGARGGWGIEAADFCRFLAFSGCRIGETKTVTWASIDRQKKTMAIHGEKTETSDRVIPLFFDLDNLLKKVAARRRAAAVYAVDGKPTLAATDRVFRLSECQKTIDKACAVTGVTRITHHDFRHLFATRCIESGVDIPTVSRWLGHNDGGALAMKTYGHLRQEHSQAQAEKVRF